MSDDFKDLVVLATTAVSVPLGLYQPWLCALMWGWLGFFAPHRVVYGSYAGATLWWVPVGATLVGVMRRRRLHLPRRREMWLLVAFWGFCAVTTAVAAVHPERAWHSLALLSQTVILGLVVVASAPDRRRFTALLWVTALAVGAYAVWGAGWVLASGGAEPLYGPRASDAENNNDLAPVLLAVLPFFAYLGQRSPRRWLRRSVLCGFAAVAIAVLGTYSRASVLGLVAVLSLLLLCRRWPALLAFAAAFAIFLTFTPPQKFFSRVATIGALRQDASAAMRPGEWYVAWRVGLDHPWLGAGFKPFDNATYRRYLPDSTDHRDAHNLFLQVLAEHGFPGLALYAALLASTFATLQRLARHGGDAGWVGDAARMIQIGLVGYVVAAQFHCLSYRPLLIDLLLLAMLLDTVAPAPPHSAAPRALHS